MLLKDQKRWKVTKEDGEYVIRGKRGVIAQYGDGSLNVWVLNVWIANKISNSLHTYDDGADFSRRFEDLDWACGVIKARKRRQMTPEALERLSRMRSLIKNPLVAKRLSA